MNSLAQYNTHKYKYKYKNNHPYNHAYMYNCLPILLECKISWDESQTPSISWRDPGHVDPVMRPLLESTIAQCLQSPAILPKILTIYNYRIKIST